MERGEWAAMAIVSDKYTRTYAVSGLGRTAFGTETPSFLYQKKRSNRPDGFITFEHNIDS